MTPPNLARSILLIVLAAGVVTVFGRTVRDPSSAIPKLPAFTFPSTSPLPGWQAAEAFVEPGSTPAQSFVARYVQTGGAVPMEIDMRYIMDMRTEHRTDPKVPERYMPAGYMPLDMGTHFLLDPHNTIRGNFKNVAPSLGNGDVQTQPGLGSYTLWDDGEQMHLIAFVDESGASLATREQLGSKTAHQLLDVKRVARWIVGKTPLPDTRLVMVDISTSNHSPDAAQHQLEAAWTTWHEWCVKNFPKTAL